MPWQNDLTLSPSVVKVIGKNGEAAFSFHSLITAPEDFTDSIWDLKVGDSVGGSAIMPDGTTGTTNGHIGDTDVGGHYVGIHESGTPLVFEDNANYCWQAYVKAGLHSKARISIVTKAGIWRHLEVDLTNGAMGGLKNVDYYGVEGHGNGWYKIWVANDLGTGGQNGGIYIYALSDYGDANAQGDGSSPMFYMWGAQAHKGTAPMPYLPLYANQNYRLRLVDGSGYEIYGYIGGQDEEELLGGEEVTNGGFDADSDWSKGDGWSIAAGVAYSDGSQLASSGISQALTGWAVTDRLYKTIFTVQNYVAGGIRIQIGAGGASSDNQTANVTLPIYLVYPGNWNNLNFYNTDDFEGELDDVSIKQVVNVGLDGVEMYNRTEWPVARNWNGDTANFNWNDVATAYIQSEYTTYLDASAREANIRDSIKKYFVDNVHRGLGVQVMFDRTLSTPKTSGQRPVKKWVSIVFGYIDLDTLSEINLDIIVATRKDPEGYQLAHLRDKVMAYLIDTTQTDGMARIPFYKSQEGQPWTLLGAMVVQTVGPESMQMIEEDETKFKIIPARLRWGTKV